MNTDYARKNQQIANSFYNLGLEKARIRDLSGAAQCLKKSLHFNKYQTDARNLLGLIYYENGEVADALVQWVISLNLQPEDNLADHYLDEIQRKPGQLEIESQNVKTFNQALWHAQNGSDDLAILQLARVVESNPHFVKAHLLLALLYMAREDFNKAGRCLYKILQIDKSNQKALYYMSIVKQNTGRADAEKRKMVKAFSHRKMEDDDVIIPNTYNPNSVAPPEMKLLYLSILEDGYTQPIVCYYSAKQDLYAIVDGFHRWRVMKEHRDIYEREQGMLPVAVIDKPLSNRMASTIRHNRARGSHNVDLMSNIIKELHELGRSDAWIAKHLGMDKDEVLRLKQITGLAALFRDVKFGQAWRPVEEDE